MNFLFILNSIALGVGLAMDAFSVSIANGLNEPHMSRGKMCGIAGTYAGYQFAMPMIGWFCVHTIAEQFQAFQKFIPWIALILLAYIGGSMLIEGIRKRTRGDKEEKEIVEDRRKGRNSGDTVEKEEAYNGACPSNHPDDHSNSQKTIAREAGKHPARKSNTEAAAEEFAEEGHLKVGTLMIQGLATSIDALSVGFTIAEYGTAMAFISSMIIAVVTFFICMSGLIFGKKFGTRLSDKASILGGLILIGIGLEIFITGVF